jgi:hypothetical protein
MYCLPAIIYIVLSIFGILYSLLSESINIGMVFFEIIFVWLFGWFLDFLCRRGYTVASWGLILFPFIFIAALFFGTALTPPDSPAQKAQIDILKQISQEMNKDIML